MKKLEIIKTIFKQKDSKYALIATFLFSIIFLLISTKYIVPSFEEQIMLNTIDESKRVSNHLISIYEKDKKFTHIKSLQEDLNIEKIKFFDKNGLVIYSTSKKDIGEINKRDYFHNIVAKGEVFYKIVKKGKKTLENRLIKTDVAEVYIPILKNNEFIYAFEVYYDISLKVKNFNELLFKINLLNTFTIILIFVLVFIRLYSINKFRLKEKITQQQLIKSEKMASMGEMVGNIAHQWRQPLSVISLGVTSMKMQKELGILDNETFIKTCNNINKNAQYLSRTIDDFKNYLKGDRELVTYNLKNCIEDFLLLVNSSIKNHHIQIISDLKDNIEVTGYPNELSQSLINIFNNSKDVLKEINEENRYIFISTNIEDDKVTIDIKDNGGGIPDDIKEKIFEPYFTTKHQSQGTGLGLHMTYILIVEGLKGKIDVSNIEYLYDGRKYKGAKFTIVIPNNIS